MEAIIMHRSTVSAFVLALVLITPSLAHAEEAQQEVVVRLGDIDPTTERGAEHALRRIRRAAEDVCDASPGLRPYAERVAARACIHDAVSRAVDDLGDPLVAAKFNGDRVYATRGVRS
jgi:UrcA family protein